jgi:hypothetical protein
MSVAAAVEAAVVMAAMSVAVDPIPLYDMISDSFDDCGEG